MRLRSTEWVWSVKSAFSHRCNLIICFRLELLYIPDVFSWSSEHEVLTAVFTYHINSVRGIEEGQLRSYQFKSKRWCMEIWVPISIIQSLHPKLAYPTNSKRYCFSPQFCWTWLLELLSINHNFSIEIFLCTPNVISFNTHLLESWMDLIWELLWLEE